MSIFILPICCVKFDRENFVLNMSVDNQLQEYRRNFCFESLFPLLVEYLGKGVNERGKMDKGHWKLKLQLCPCSTNIPEIRIIISLFINKSSMRSSYFHLPVTVSRDRGTCHPPPIGMRCVSVPPSRLWNAGTELTLSELGLSNIWQLQMSLSKPVTPQLYSRLPYPLFCLSLGQSRAIERGKEWKYRCFLKHQLMDDCEKTSSGGRRIIVYRPGSWNCQLTLLSYLCISFSCRFARIDVVMFRGLYKGHHG